MSEKSCLGCAFLDRRSGDNECHRFPPAVLWLGSHASNRFPRVQVYDWCGEFKEKAL